MGDKRRLGRGLNALIPDFPDLDESHIERFADLPVKAISPNPFQPREEVDPVALNELKLSIAEKGVIQPVTVRRIDGGYQLIAGERRLRAVRELGYEQIPAYILKIDSDGEMLELALIENIQREDLNAIDVAHAYQRLILECSLTQEQVAQKVGKDRTTITNFLRLLKLPQVIQDSLRKNEISMGHARSLLGVADDDLQIKIWHKIVRHNLSVRRVEQLVKETAAGPSNQAKPTYLKKSQHIIFVEDKFREVFGTQVRIFPKKEGGKIEIEFYSNDDLERIFNILTANEKDY